MLAGHGLVNAKGTIPRSYNELQIKPQCDMAYILMYMLSYESGRKVANTLENRRLSVKMHN